MQQLQATIVIKFNAEDDLPMENINAHLRNLLVENLHDRLELVNIDYVKVEKSKNLEVNRDVSREAQALTRAMDMNTWLLWTPDFKQVIEAIILRKVEFEDEGKEFKFDGVDFEKLNLVKALKNNEDFGED
jgi:hypothetical protein